MYGGDWPISVMAGGYAHVWEGLSAVFASLRDEQRHAILSTTARQFYRLPDAG